MNTRDFYNQSAKLRSAFVLLCLLGISSAPGLRGRAQELTSPPAFQNPSSANMDLDEDPNWQIYEELGDPLSEVTHVTSPSLDGYSLRCAILGGEPGTNVHCYNNRPAEANSNVFLLSISFYYRPKSTFNQPDSIVQALEFTTSKWKNGLRYEWALQWENVGTGAPKWRYWDPSHPDKWVDTGLSGGINGVAWHTLVLEGGIFNGHVHYRRFILDGQTFPLDIVVEPASEPVEPDKLAVAVQLDGNYREDPYELFIDDVRLITAESFADVPFHYWAFEWIQRLYGANITGGCGTNPLQYCPDSEVTRAQMAVFLERGIHGSSYTPPAIGSSTGFNDVSTSYWSAAWIKQLAADGITGGCGAGQYCPDYPVTRAQMAVFLLKAKYGPSYLPPAVGSNTGFNDVAANYWAAAWIKQLAAEGITGGCGTNLYCPESPVTRAQMAVFLVKTFNLP